MKRVLITGGSGQVGSDLAGLLAAEHQVYAPTRYEWDLSLPGVPAAVRDWHPDYLVNCAAFTKVDACESQRELAWRINAVAPGEIAEACYEMGIPILHLSTDYVFDGRKALPEPYRESDEPAPISAYGETKLEGEKQIQLNAGDWIVLRTSWVYGRQGRNFLKAILAKALRGEALTVVEDQVGTPTWSAALARQIRDLISSPAHGLYHASAEGQATWYELAREFLKLMEVHAELRPCSTEDFPTAAHRPANALLENARLKAEGLNRMRDWKQDLAEFVQKHRNELLKEAQA